MMYQVNTETNEPLLSIHQGKDKTIWAVGGGKGGTGKSFVSASLAIQLANLEKDVTLIDADLGGPNLHTFLGMKESNLDLGDFVTNKVPNLKDTVILTPFAGLKLIKGTENVLFMAHPLPRPFDNRFIFLRMILLGQRIVKQLIPFCGEGWISKEAEPWNV